jgi:hypothetical protein
MAVIGALLKTATLPPLLILGSVTTPSLHAFPFVEANGEWGAVLMPVEGISIASQEKLIGSVSKAAHGVSGQ